MTQSEAILKYLQGGNKITALEALSLFQCFRLASRINDLKRDKTGQLTNPHNIESETITIPSGKKVSQYFIARKSMQQTFFQ